MSRAVLIAELATGHGGDLAVAEDMIRAAADSGADYAKVQTYSLERLNPHDPQAEWLRQAHLDEAAHVRLMGICEQVGIRFLSTPFDVDSLTMLRRLWLRTFKIASTESRNNWWAPAGGEFWFVSWPWGKCHAESWQDRILHSNLTAIPLYPTPLECVGQVPLLDGWSDHCVGLSACRRALVLGAKIVEVHICLPDRSRVMVFDKSPEQVRQLRMFAEDCETMASGVSEQFRTRWSA